MTIRLALGWLLLSTVLTVHAEAQPAVFIVRHAERADTAAGGAPAMNADPDLSDAGRARARTLAAMLKDAGITAVYATQYKRTQQTAAPLADALKLTPIIVNSSDTAGLVMQLATAGGDALVVGHSNTVVEIARALGADTSIEIADDEYDNLFIVVRGSPPRLIRLRYR